MKVGIVIGQLSNGGAERQLSLLAQGMKNRGDHDPVVFCMSNDLVPFGGVLKNAGVELRYYPFARGRYPQKLSWLLTMLRGSCCSLVYGILNSGNIYAGAVSTALRLPLVASVRNADARLPWMIQSLSGLFCWRASWVIANSESCRRSLRADLGVKHDRVSVIPNAVDLPFPAPGARARIRTGLGVRQGELVIGTVASLKAQKRPGFFVQTYRALRQVLGTDVHFVWVGCDGVRLARLHSAMPEIDAPEYAKLHFLPATTLVADVLSAFDIFVLTSAYEGLPNALLEAMSAGLPSVATDVEGTRDVGIAPDGTGLKVCVLAPRDDPESFAYAVAELAGRSDEMLALGERAKAYVRECFTVEKMVERYIDVFERVTATRTRPQGNV